MERLRYIREQAGYSQQDLADESGVSQHTISEIELGRRKPQGRTLRKLARVLGVEVADFYPKGHSPFSAEWALTLADSDSFRREAKGASTEELRQTALELAAFMKPQTHEEALEHRGDKEYRRETQRRVIAHERLGIIQGELAERGAPSPVELVVKRHNDATTPAEETARSIPTEPTEREGQEAG